RLTENMYRVTNRRDCCFFLPSLMLILSALCCLFEAYAEDMKAAAASLVDQSFALLDQLSRKGGAHAAPLLGKVAGFAGDADSLRQSLARSDLRSANSNITALEADRAEIDQALKLNPHAVAAPEWSALEGQVDKIARAIPRCSRPSDCGPAPSVEREFGSATSTIDAASEGPRIVIASRQSKQVIERLTGYFEGTALTSAGIYEGSTCLKDFHLRRVPGRQKIEFVLKLENPSAQTVLRITDAEDRITESAVLDPNV